MPVVINVPASDVLLPTFSVEASDVAAATVSDPLIFTLPLTDTASWNVAAPTTLKGPDTETLPPACINPATDIFVAVPNSASTLVRLEPSPY